MYRVRDKGLGTLELIYETVCATHGVAIPTRQPALGGRGVSMYVDTVRRTVDLIRMAEAETAKANARGS
jgi:hypothetical protein